MSKTKLPSSLLSSVVAFESYWNETPRIKKVVSASTITGVTDATLNGAKSFTSWFFCVVDKFCPVLFLIDMKTFPYSGVDDTPVETS